MAMTDVDVVGRDDADRCDARDLACVLADLVLAVHQHPDQIEHRAVGEVPNSDLSDVAGHPLNDSIGHAAARRRRLEYDWQRAESAGDRVAVEVRHGVGCQLVVGHSRQDLFDADAEFQARQVGAEAAVDARAESEVPVGLAVEDAAIRLGKLVGVTIGRGVVDQDRFAGAERVAVQLDFLGDGPRDAVDRPAEADQFLDGARHDVGLADEPVALVGMGCEVVERERHRARGGFEAGLDQKHRVGHDVGEGELLAVDLGREKDVDHVVLRRRVGSRGHRVVDVLIQPTPGRHARFLGIVR